MHQLSKSARRYLSWAVGIFFLGLLALWPATTLTSLAAAPVPDSEDRALPAETDPTSKPASAGDQIWQDVNEARLKDAGDERLIIPKAYRLVAADITALDTVLNGAPLENSATARSKAVVLNLPLPDGTFGRFQIEESPVMAPELAAKYPEIKTYRGWGLDDPTATARLDRTPAGFHGLILANSSTVYIDPYRKGDIVHYISYFKHDYDNIWGKERGELGVVNPDGLTGKSDVSIAVSSGPTLRTYRLAVAATAEYTAFHGGTVGGALAAINTTMNRVNGIYEREVSVRMILIANNNAIIYTDAGTDPYTNDQGGTMLTQNQTNLDIVIDEANYDIGHVFSTGGGGVASLRSPCNSGFKARGVTGQGTPVGDAFDVDFVAHEMGHQFGANHTFNADGQFSCGGGNRNPTTAFEPGSGSTIMAYAGICGAQDLQPHSDDYFHGASFDEITAFITDAGIGGGDTCAVKTATGNTAPTIEAGPDYTIPEQTPFTLSGSATDAEGDPLTHQWEEFDLGNPPADLTTLPNTDGDGNARPIFRSFNPVLITARTFPTLTNILDGSHANNGESLPTIARTMQFRLTARDNKGGVNNDSMSVTVDGNSGPFAVTDPNTAVTWTGLATETVTWDVANTTAAPVSCANVNILLSTDGGFTFPVTLVTNTANDGTETLFAPANSGTTTARVKVECAGNIFFDISNTNFTITDIAGPSLAITKTLQTAGGPVNPGEPITFTIVVANSGAADATDVQVVDTLPLEVVGPNLDTTTTITAGQSVTFTINATVAPAVVVGTVVTNTASYSYTFGSNQDSVSFTVGQVVSNTTFLPAILKN